jgi:DNA-binding transcriptional ArsR family regulator
MLRIHFSTDDIAGLRMVDGVGPLFESVFALNLLGGGDTLFSAWRRRVRDCLGPSLPEVERLTQRHRPVPELLAKVQGSWTSPTGPPGTDPVLPRRSHATLLEFCHRVVLPHWGSVRSYLHEEREARARAAISSGLDGLLRTLHPKVRWRPPVLQVAHERDLDVHLRGRGLLLRPSFYFFDEVRMIIDGPGTPRTPTLVFSVPVREAAVAALQRVPEWNEPGLEALLGHTRAAALQILVESCTTGELAGRLGVSLPAASKHATILRNAGLIATARSRNTGLHTLTSLGIAVLRADGTMQSGRRRVVREAGLGKRCNPSIPRRMTRVVTRTGGAQRA